LGDTGSGRKKYPEAGAGNSKEGRENCPREAKQKRFWSLHRGTQTQRRLIKRHCIVYTKVVILKSLETIESLQANI
jgi:hypothetical protein